MNRLKCRSGLAALLSLIIPGLGHIYACEARRGLIAVASIYFLFLLLGLGGFVSSLGGFYTMLAVAVLGFGWIIVDAWRVCRRRQFRSCKKYNNWTVYILFSVLILGIQFTFPNCRSQCMGYESFRLASESMSPGLQKNDYVLVNTRYRKKLPFSVGDVVVFKALDDQKLDYVKRIAGFGGDTIEIRNGEVYRNGEMVAVLSVPREQRKRSSSHSFSRVTIPLGHLFMLGDWRDNSNDSRNWGALPEENVTGKVNAVWLSDELSRIGSVPGYIASTVHQ